MKIHAAQCRRDHATSTQSTEGKMHCKSCIIAFASVLLIISAASCAKMQSHNDVAQAQDEATAKAAPGSETDAASAPVQDMHGAQRISDSPRFTFNTDVRLAGIALSSDGGLLAYADLDRSVYLLSLKKQSLLWQVTLPAKGAISEEDIALAFAQNEKYILISSYVRDPLVLDVKSGAILRTFDGGGEWFAPSVGIWDNGGLELAVTASNGDVHCWDPSNADEKVNLRGAGENVIALHVASQSSTMATGLWANGEQDQMENGRLLVRKLPSGKIELDVRQGKTPLRHIALLPDGEHVVAGSQQGIACWSIVKKQQLWSNSSECDGLAITADGKTMAYINGTQIVLCRIPSGKVLSKTTCGQHKVSIAVFTGDGTAIATGSSDGSIALWQISQ